MSDQPYLVSARKYRPQAWDAVVGQSGITQTLQQSIASGQIAQAYLFCGPRGVGKTTSARIFAKAINGFDGQEEAMSFNVFELDAASNNKVEDIRSIVDQVRIPPQQGKYKVYIIDEVHMLSQAAFNAFLKTLEEPPAHAVFILATTEKHKILPTILSRCQIFDFHRITVPDAVAHLQHIAAQEGVQAEEEALHVIAQKADGALRDALSMFDQLVAFAGKNLTYQAVTEQLHVLDHDTYFTLTDQALASDIPGAMLLFNDVMARGFDAHHFITGWGGHLRNLMVAQLRLSSGSGSALSSGSGSAQLSSGSAQAQLSSQLRLSSQAQLSSKKNLATPGGGITSKKNEDEGLPTGPVIDESWSDEVDEAGVRKAWDAFVQRLRDEDRISVVATMAQEKPSLQGLVVTFPVHNPLQREQVDELKTEMLVHLKTTLKNAGLQLKVEMKETPADEKMAFLSDRERYDMMVEKNPQLDKLRQALDLDLG